MAGNNQIIAQGIQLPFKIKKSVLALGGQGKNTLCFAQGQTACLSRTHGDLSLLGPYREFENDAQFFLKKHPRVIAYDLHPEYQSTKYAFSLEPGAWSLEPVQHHHAHICACMADNGLKNEKVLGIAFDGTGQGEDNSIWGGEVLIASYQGFQRAGHLREIPLLGGEQAVREPWRSAAAWLEAGFGERFLGLKIDFVRGISKQKWRVLKAMSRQGFNSPLASSMGRLFDAAAALILNKQKAGFEAELAMELEKLAQGSRLKAQGYKIKVTKDKERYILDPLPMFKEISRDLSKKRARAEVAFAFHLGIAGGIKDVCTRLRETTKINKVVLSGGVFQNRLLSGLSAGLLANEGFKVLTHRRLSCSDSSLSLGQAMIAAARNGG